MVEGPGATRNGRKVLPLVGLVLKELSIQQAGGNDNGRKSNGSIATDLRPEGRLLESTFSVGKEVFLILGPVLPVVHHGKENNNNTNKEDEIKTDKSGKPIALRLHFGMNGCLTVRKVDQPSKLAPWRKRDKSSDKCTITFGNSNGDSSTLIIETVASTCTFVSAIVARSKLDRLRSKDVCSDSTTFEAKEVMDSIIEKRPTSMVCDAILDQERFPGVGNIIKIEGLHKAGVHPRRLVETLSTDELMRVIIECRNYAMGWLSNGRAPSKKVYNQMHCLSCKNGRVKMVKMGKDLSRVTFWCERCQPLIATRSGLANASMQTNNERYQQTSSVNRITEFDTKNNSAEKQSMCASSYPRYSCPIHGSKRLLLRRVRNKSSPNLHRLFRTCGVRGCQYFCWADSHFPKCKCRPYGSGSTKAVLKVSKTERTGGQWFLSCAISSSSGNSGGTGRPKNSKGCSFFQWATPEQLAPISNDLSPLT